MDCRIIKREMMRNLKYQFVLVLVFLMQWANAQPTFENEDVQDVPEVPVDQWINTILLITIITGYFLSQKKKLTVPK